MNAPMNAQVFGWFQIIRLGLIQACLGAVVVVTTSTLNRIMVVEMALPAMLPGNLDQTRTAPVTVIVATDTRFFEFMPKVWHREGAKENFESNSALASATATRNGTLGGAYFILAARALGLDCGPMSGVDLAKVDAEFFPDGRWKANFLINLGFLFVPFGMIVIVGAAIEHDRRRGVAA